MNIKNMRSVYQAKQNLVNNSYTKIIVYPIEPIFIQFHQSELNIDFCFQLYGFLLFYRQLIVMKKCKVKLAQTMRNQQHKPVRVFVLIYIKVYNYGKIFS